MVSSKFILVKHEALKRGTHFDLRFRMPNSKNWVSFALNASPPTEPGKRMSIVRTNDHSEKEALFVGKIPEGEYGAGKLTKIDGGDCKIIKFTNAQMTVNFEGTVLQGTYHFINVGVFDRSRNYSKKVYIFFKAKQNISEQQQSPDVNASTILKNLLLGRPSYDFSKSFKSNFSNVRTYIRLFLIPFFWFLYCFGVIFLGSKALDMLPKKKNDKLTNKLRKITGDEEITIYEVLYERRVNAFTKGTPELYYFTGFVTRLKLTEDELISVLLHEYGHYKENHMLQAQAIIIGGTTLATALINLLRIAPSLRITLILYLQEKNEAISKVLSRSMRYQEVKADEYPAKYGYKEQYISALKKLKKFLYAEICPGLSMKECEKLMNDLHRWDEHPNIKDRLKVVSSKAAKKAMSVVSKTLETNNKEKLDMLIDKVKNLYVSLALKGTGSQFIDKDVLSRL